MPGALWMVPPQAGVWIPGGTLHSNRGTANALIFFLFVEPGAAPLPASCCNINGNDARSLRSQDPDELGA
ncbi:Uncharacterised protein [Mycobacterium tuberculosis]|nr:Uncharacterised protein [Mycobacterium tuberculosis]